MKKVVFVGGLALATIVAVAFVIAPRTSAQGDRVYSPGITAQFQSFDAGSSIGATVRDQQPGEAAGVIIENVQDGTPAMRAGLQKGDVVVEFDGERARSAQQFTRLVRETPAGRAVKMIVVRAGSKRTFDITPEAWDSSVRRQFPNINADVDRAVRAFPRDFRFDFFGETPFGSSRRLGVSVTPLSDQLASYFGVKDGVLVSEVMQNTPAASSGLKAGDVITSVNGHTVMSPSDLSQEVRSAQAGSTLELRVTRDRKETSIKVMLPESRRPTGGTQPL